MTRPAIGPAHRRERPLAIALLLLLSVVPLLAVDFPPLVDLYAHLGRYAIQTGGVDLPAYYSFEWRLIGNLGADLLIEILEPVFGLETGVQVIVIANQLLAAAAIVWISREVHGRVTPFAILALPLIYAYPFSYGFVNFTLSMALALLIFAGWLRLRRVGKIGAARLLLLIASLPLWLCHTFGWAFLGLLCGASALASHWRGWNAAWPVMRMTVFDCAGLLIPLVPMLLWRGATSGAETGDWSIMYKSLWLISTLRTSWPVLDIASTTFLLCTIYMGWRGRAAGFDPRIGLAALFALIAFLILPARVFSSFYADMRLLPYAIMLGLLALSPAKMNARTTTRWMVAGLLFLVFRIGLTTADYRLKQAEVDAALPALAQLPAGAAVATFVIEPCDTRWRMPVLRHVGGIALARRQVFANNQWNLPGVTLLTIEHSAAGAFGADPSQTVAPAECPRGDRQTLAAALRSFPRPAFTHVWVLGDLSPAPPEIAGYALKWRNPSGAVYQRLEAGR